MMSNHNVRLFLLTFMFICFIIGNTLLSSELGFLNANIELSTGKNVYYTYEPIHINIKFDNFSKENIDIISEGYIKHHLIVKNEYGEKLKYRFPTGHPIEPDILEPGESFQMEPELTQLFGNGDKNIAGCYDYLNPGSYTIQLIWTEGRIFDSEYVSFEPIKSNILNIEVTEPKGDDKKAKELLEQAQLLNYGKKRFESTEKYRELLKKYPNSVYRSRVHRKAIQNHKFRKSEEDKKKTLAFSRDLLNYELNKQSVSHYSLISLDYIVKHEPTFLDSKLKRDYLNNLYQKSKDKKVKKWIEKIQIRE